jgi:nucleoside-diphosphate-sugar epimerase
VSRQCRTVLVTGAQGFTGRYLTHHWLAQDETVRIIGVGRSPHRPDTFAHRVGWRGRQIDAPLPSPLRVLDAGRRYIYRCVDLVQTDMVAAVLEAERVDTVIHLAASLRDDPFQLLIRNNVASVQSLFAAAVQVGRPDLRIVVCSSGSIYGAVADDALPISERHWAAPLDLYAATKRAAEDVAAVYGRRHGLDVVVARVFNVVGAGEDERHLAPHLARQFAERRAARSAAPIAVGPLDTTRDFVDVRDVVAALVIVAIEGRPGDVVNVASGVECPTRRLFDILAELSGQADAMIDARPARRLDCRRQCADITRLRALGFAPQYTMRDSLDALLRYYLDDVAAAADGGERYRCAP